MNNRIRLAICDDSKHFINSMRLEIMDTDNVEIVGEEYEACKCISMVKETQPDVLLLDIQMETATAGIDIIPALKSNFPDMKIIMLTVSEIDHDIFNALSQGADNYILKNISNSDIIQKVIETYNGDFAIDKNILNKYFNHSKITANDYQSLLFFVTIISALTKSELQVLRDLCDKKTYTEIASARYTTEGTVRTITSHIVKKFHIDNIGTLVDKINQLDLFCKFDKLI